MNTPYSLLGELEKVKDLAHPPIHLWNPDNVKDIDMEIRRDGSWYHEGAPVERQRLVRLFSTVLRKEDDGDYYLVTPVEKCRIKVEDAPFVAVLLTISGEGSDQALDITTNVAEQVPIDRTHPIVMKGLDDGERLPYIHVRDGLEALASRNVYYELVGLMVTEELDGETWHGVWSRGTFFPFARSEDLG
jgi:hypothetical protein